MEPRRNALLAEMARDASLERSDFLVRAGEQLERFMTDQAARIQELGGLTLIDDDPDYLAVAPDGTFRSRSRVFRRRARRVDLRDRGHRDGRRARRALQPRGHPAGIRRRRARGRLERHAARGGPGQRCNGIRTPRRPTAGPPGNRRFARPTTSGARRPRCTSWPLDFQERSQRAESGLIEQFENAAAGLLGEIGTLVIVDDEDEHLALEVGGFRGKVIPEGESTWQDIAGAEQIVRFYDPTDVFGDLAEALAEAYPEVSGDGCGRR